MRSLSPHSARSLSAFLALLLLLLSGAEGIDALRHRHVYCAVHGSVEHVEGLAERHAQPGTGHVLTQTRGAEEHGEACVLSAIGSDPVLAEAPRVTALPIAPGPAPSLWRDAAPTRAPPLSYAPKTSPPTLSA